MTDCTATGPLGEVCTRGVHKGDQHVQQIDLTDTAAERLFADDGDPRAALLTSTSWWVGDRGRA